MQIEFIGGQSDDQFGPAGQPRTGTAAGPAGYIVTAAVNLPEKPEVIVVRLPDGQRANAEIVGRDETRHLVMLRIDESLAPRPLETETTAKTGQTAFALGKAFDPTSANLTTGIVSATGRMYGRALQTDAGVSANNYGGPLLDLNGRVLGILVPMSPGAEELTAGVEWYDSGIGFAVPLDDMRLAQMASGQMLQRGLAGISFRDRQGYASRPVIATVNGDSPARRAGIEQGDVITSVNGQSIELLSQFRQLMGPMYAGDRVELGVKRDNKPMEFELVLVDQIDPWQHAMMGALAAMETGLSDGIRLQFVLPDGPADRAGLQTGDRIMAVDGQAITSREELAEQLANKPAGSEIQLDFVRGQQAAASAQFQLDRLAASPWPTDSLPPDDDVGERPLIEIAVAEDPTPGWAWVPDTAPAAGLLVWLGQPGKLNQQQEIGRWRETCQQHNMALLLVPSANADGWKPDEAARIKAAIGQIRSQFDIDARRIAIGGSGAAGNMASICALQAPALFRGLIQVDSVPDRRVRGVETSSTHRQLVLLLESTGKSPGADLVRPAAEALADNGFPAHHQATDSELIPRVITQWVFTLDRF